MQTSSDRTTAWIAPLRAELKGRVIEPHDPEYDRARTVFYGGYDRRPALIARVADASDVARVVSVARDGGMELAVRGGGHSTAGHSVSDGGIVVDLTEMKGLEIDPAGRTAWAETGLTAGEYTDAAGKLGLATGFGDTASVGIGGITLGGGIGYLARKYGMTIDDLLAAEVVTADGEILLVDADNHPDLFWAIRGGGGNFGIATRFKFRLHDVPQVVGGMLFLPATAEVINGFVELAEAAPEELSTIANVMTAPPMPFLPEELHGQVIVMGLMCYAGDPDEGERVLAPFRALATPLADMVQPMAYPGVYPAEEGAEEYHPLAANHTMFVDTIDDKAVDDILDRINAGTAMMNVTQIRVLGGAMARVPSYATAFAHRTSKIMVNVAAVYMEGDDPSGQGPWVADLVGKLRQSDDGAYVGFLGDEGPDRVRKAYPDATWKRLAEIKKRYDPTNLFRLNQNIPPAE